MSDDAAMDPMGGGCMGDNQSSDIDAAYASLRAYQGSLSAEEAPRQPICTCTRDREARGSMYEGHELSCPCCRFQEHQAAAAAAEGWLKRAAYQAYVARWSTAQWMRVAQQAWVDGGVPDAATVGEVGIWGAATRLPHIMEITAPPTGTWGESPDPVVGGVTWTARMVAKLRCARDGHAAGCDCWDGGEV